jgi:hypothetical protein
MGDAYLHTQRLGRYDSPRTLHQRVLRDPRDGPMGPFPTGTNSNPYEPLLYDSTSMNSD